MLKVLKSYYNFLDKMNAIREQAPEIYDAILNMGKTKQVFEVILFWQGLDSCLL